MFEAVIALCLSLADGPCRDVLLPGYEAESRAACETRLESRAPVLPAGLTRGAPRCVASGPALEVSEAAPGLFVHRGQIAEPDAVNLGDVSNLGFVIGDSAVAVIDSGSAAWIGEATWRAIRARTDKPVSHVILTHMHPDHVLGASVFARAGAQVVGHARLPRALADRQANYLESLSRLIGAGAFLGTEAPAIDIAITDTLDIDLGNRRLTLHAHPAAHTGTDVTVLDQTSGTLFTGDLVFHLHTPALDGKLTGWQALLADMAGQGFARIVPGHGGPLLNWPEAAEPMQRYLDVLARDTRAAIAAGERLGTAITHIAQGEADHWHLFDAYNPRNATVAFTELEWE